MAAKSKKRISSKPLHVFYLRALIFWGVCVLIAVFALLLMNILLPVTAQEEQPPLLGTPSAPFRFTKENIFPFTLAPLMILVICYLYLNRYFSKNSVSSVDHIPYFRKHPHTRFNKKVTLFFLCISNVLFVASASVCHLQKGISEVWFGAVTMIGTSILLYQSLKTLRHARRQYFAQKRYGMKTKGE